MILVGMRSPVVVHDFSLLYDVICCLCHVISYYFMLFTVFWKPVGFSTYIFWGQEARPL